MMETVLVKNPKVETRQQQFEKLYLLAFPSVAKYIRKKGGSLEEAKDVFQDALLIYYEKVLLPQQAKLHPEAYIMGIIKNLWAKRFSYQTRYLQPLPLQIEDSITDMPVPTPDQSRLLMFLTQAGKKCMDLLSALYFGEDLMAPQPDNHGYASSHSASVQKYKCLEKVRNTIKQKSLAYEDFFE